MDRQGSLKAFLAQYFPAFICAFFLACFSLSVAISLASSTFFRSDPERARYSFLAAVFLGLLLAFSHFVMIRGREWGAWAIAAFYVVCFLVVLPTYSYRPHMAAYVIGLLFPLLGLLLFNSKRHREMRQKLVELRQLRKAAIAKHKSR
ncbi:hypothetical protein F3K50_20700 [Pseudomonas marginalis]|nr:hypothetical protein F3K50_20700 [Pseudomonas marginalis]